MKKKFVIAIVAVALAIGGVVGGTLAWLTAQTDKVENTFTVGKIEIKLEETTDPDYKIVPGATEPKDPTITVESGSEKCFVYAKVENNVKLADGTVAAVPNINTTNWIEVGTSGNVTLYRYASEVDATTAAKELPVFTQVTYPAGLTEANIGSLDNTTIVITAYAHQSSAGLDTANLAANAWAGTTAITPAG